MAAGGKRSPAVVTSGGKEGELVMASVKYDIEVQVSRVSVSRLLSEYWNPDPVREACKLCPDYGKVWSCPPGVPEADALFEEIPGRISNWSESKISGGDRERLSALRRKHSRSEMRPMRG